MKKLGKAILADIKDSKKYIEDKYVSDENGHNIETALKQIKGIVTTLVGYAEGMMSLQRLCWYVYVDPQKVRLLQEILSEGGVYYTGDVTGIYDVKTHDALLRFLEDVEEGSGLEVVDNTNTIAGGAVEWMKSAEASLYVQEKSVKDVSKIYEVIEKYEGKSKTIKIADKTVMVVGIIADALELGQDIHNDIINNNEISRKTWVDLSGTTAYWLTFVGIASLSTATKASITGFAAKAIVTGTLSLCPAGIAAIIALGVGALICAAAPTLIELVVEGIAGWIYDNRDSDVLQVPYPLDHPEAVI